MKEKIRQLTQFMKEVRIETRKVTFPNRNDTVATTAVVIGVVVIISFYLGLVDFTLSKLIGMAI